MGRFRSPKSQAQHAIKQRLAIGKSSHGEGRSDGKIHSLGTSRTYSDSLKGVAEFIAERQLDPMGNGLASLNRNAALAYLEFRCQEVGQKQLDKDRQAIQAILEEKLPAIQSELDQVLQSRAYTQQQILLVASAQSPKHSLATLIAADGGLRAHELLTLLPIQARPPSAHREWTDDRFDGRKNTMRYTVAGKGGLVREVAISDGLAIQMEILRFSEPRKVTDREIFYDQYYDIGGGKKWSDSFSKAAQRELGWSAGAHGLRHTFAQDRMRTLQANGYAYGQALSIVSQEMGHFRPEITEVYLR